MTIQSSQKGHRRRRRRASLLLLFLTFLLSFFLISVWTGFHVAAILSQQVKEFNSPLLLEWQAALQKAISPSSPTPLIRAQNRSFTWDPITAEESAILAQHDKASGMKTAVCHRTLFGDQKISLDPLFAFVSYYRLLGFDHIFFWYRPNITKLSRFDELSSLPYVTMTEYTGGGREDGQLVVEEECLSNSTFAANYNWTLTIDADEYLWFNSHMSIKDFLSDYDSNYTFLSFGKWMYTTMHGVKVEEDSGFGFDSLAFTAKSHCTVNFGVNKMFLYPRPPTYSYCPSHYARSKVIVKPAFHKKVNIHGMGFDLRKPGLMHFDTSIAHLKEWRNVLLKSRRKVNYRPPTDFNISKIHEVDIISLNTGHERVGGKFLMHYDHELQDWMRFVASGCSK